MSDEAQETVVAPEEVQRLTDRLRNADWLESDGFYACKVKFGDEDFARILAISGDVVLKAFELAEVFAPVVDSISDARDEGEGLKVLLAVVRPEHRDAIWEVVVEVFYRCVDRLVLNEYAQVYGVDAVRMPEAGEPYDVRSAFVRSLPLKIVGRVLAGVAYHLGNS